MDFPPFFVPCSFHSNKASHEICTSHLSPLKLSSCLECTYRFCNISQALKVLAVLVTDYPPCQEALLKFKQDTDQGPVSGELQCVLLSFRGFPPVFDIYRASEDTTSSPSNRHFFWPFYYLKIKSIFRRHTKSIPCLSTLCGFLVSPHPKHPYLKHPGVLDCSLLSSPVGGCMPP